MSVNMPKMPKETADLTDKYNNVLSMQSKDDWKKDFLHNKDGETPKSTSTENVKIILNNDSLLKGAIKYDEFAESIVKSKSISNTKIKLDKGNWTDTDTAKLRTYIEMNYRYVPTSDAVNTGLLSFATEHSFNPVKKYIETEKWDGTKRMATYFIDYLGAENSDYTKAVTVKWFEGAVARVYQPGIKFDMVPVLSGKQGIGKSTLVSKIFPDYVDDGLTSLGKTKDDHQKLIGAWIFELGELSALSKTDIELTKGFISATKDRYRSSYGRLTQNHPRKCVFIGTSNDMNYLKDLTGNRRFYPIECGNGEAIKDPFNISQHEIHQILAEAKVSFEHGDKLILDKDIEEIAHRKQGNAMLEDPVQEQVLRFINMYIPAEWKNYSIENKRTAFENYCYELNNGTDPTSFVSTANERVSGQQPVNKLERTTTQEILYVVLDVGDRNLLNASRSGTGRKISLILNSTGEWDLKHGKHGNCWLKVKCSE